MLSLRHQLLLSQSCPPRHPTPKNAREMRALLDTQTRAFLLLSDILPQVHVPAENCFEEPKNRERPPDYATWDYADGSMVPVRFFPFQGFDYSKTLYLNLVFKVNCPLRVKMTAQLGEPGYCAGRYFGWTASMTVTYSLQIYGRGTPTYAAAPPLPCIVGVHVRAHAYYVSHHKDMSIHHLPPLLSPTQEYRAQEIFTCPKNLASVHRRFVLAEKSPVLRGGNMPSLQSYLSHPETTFESLLRPPRPRRRPFYLEEGEAAGGISLHPLKGRR